MNPISDPSVSVIIPAHNAESSLPACLDALRAQQWTPSQYEIIVVDDGSDDGTGDCAKRAGARVVTTHGCGAAAARNAGVHAATGDLILFTDADCRPTHNWVREMTRPFEDKRVVGAKGTYLSEQRSMVARFIQCEYASKYRRMEKFETIDFIDTYSAAFQRSAFIDIGGFDESYPGASVEDQEFSFRMHEAGHRMVFNPLAVVYHLHTDTITGYFRKKFRIGYWKVKVLQRHPEKAIRDSHTPQALKLQIPLAFLLVALVLIAPLLGPVPLACGLALFLALSGREVAGGLRGDGISLALLSPGLQFVRSLALGLGLASGLSATGRTSVLRSLVTASIAVVDLLILIASVIAAYYLRFCLGLGTPLPEPQEYSPPPLPDYVTLMVFTGITALLLFSLLGLYRRDRSRWTIDDIDSILKGASVSFLLATSLTFFVRTEDFEYSRLVLLYTFALGLPMLLTWHYLVLSLEHVWHKRGWDARRLAILGLTPMSEVIKTKILRQKRLGYEVVGSISSDTDTLQPETVNDILGNVDALESILTRYQIDELLVCAPEVEHHGLLDILDTVERARVEIRMVPTVYDLLVDFSGFSDLDGIPMVTLRERPNRWLGLALKRTMDIVGAILLLVLTAPLCAIVAWLIKRDSDGPVIFKQERAGLRGRPFIMLKFRTMCDNAEDMLSDLVDVSTLEEPVYKLSDDPRTTRIGQWLRCTSLDELPQLINVLRGEMSLVGPRPEVTDLVERYDRWQRRRLKIKPGMTGLQQIVCRGTTSLQRRVEYDLYYLRKWSLVMDLWILSKTLPVIIIRKGAL